MHKVPVRKAVKELVIAWFIAVLLTVSVLLLLQYGLTPIVSIINS
jgi:hypothetical protein